MNASTRNARRAPGAGSQNSIGQPDSRRVQFTANPTQALSEFINALRDAGIPPSDASTLAADGVLHRYHVEGDRRSDCNGWAVLHLDGIAAGALLSVPEFPPGATGSDYNDLAALRTAGAV